MLMRSQAAAQMSNRLNNELRKTVSAQLLFFR